MSTLLHYFTYVFNTILTKSTFPTAWKRTKILPLLKSNREFRPNAILPYLPNVIKKIIYNQMARYIKGYKPERSCLTSLTDVIENIRPNNDDNKM